MDAGGEYRIASEKNISALHLAVFKGHMDCAGRIGLWIFLTLTALLIEKGMSVNCKDESGMAPLFFAAVNRHKVRAYQAEFPR